MTTETQAQFAQRLGVTPSHVTRLKQAGRLVMDGKRVDVEASLERIGATRGSRYDVEERNAERRGAAVQGLPMAESPAKPEDAKTADVLDIDEIGRRTRLAQMREREAIANIKAREEQEQAGVLVRRTSVVKAVSDAVAVVLNATEALPDRATPLLVGINDASRIRAVLRDEVEQLFQLVSEQLGAAAGERAA